MSRLRDIEEFIPRGTVIDTPSGLMFNPDKIAGMEVYSFSVVTGPRLVIHWDSGDSTTIRFRDNVGSIPDVRAVARAITAASTDGRE